jgi:general nucleoside transport system permease protein
MMRLVPRPQPSKAMSMASPLIALAITVLVGVVLFSVLGKDPLKALQVFFIEPVKNGYALSELSVKAVPLVLIALGLSVCYRSNVWNIGAEGQFVLGAIFRCWRPACWAAWSGAPWWRCCATASMPARSWSA